MTSEGEGTLRGFGVDTNEGGGGGVDIGVETMMKGLEGGNSRCQPHPFEMVAQSLGRWMSTRRGSGDVYDSPWKAWLTGPVYQQAVTEKQ